MIVDELKKANIQAIKDRDVISRNLYSVLLNKIMLEGIKKREQHVELVDADVVAILQKSIKELEEEKANYEKVNHDVEAKETQTKIEITKKYLPQMMSEEEIKNVILKMDDKTIPSVMKFFKMNYAGKCDMGLVQKVLRNI